nr:hypothetical protein [uncultured Desulfobacter sp.]
MDFSDFITLILFFVFIFAPLLKRFKKKTVSTSNTSKQSGFSVLGKLNDVLKEAAREMQAQAEQARKKEASGRAQSSREFNESTFDRTEDDTLSQTFWDEIDDRDDEAFYAENLEGQIQEPIAPAAEQPHFVSRQKASPREGVGRQKTRAAKSYGPGAVQASCPRRGPRRLPVGPRGLQKAVVWSEILGKPVGLKDSDPSPRY